MDLKNIKTQTTWNDATQSLNSNFAKINIEVEKLGNATIKNKGYYLSEASLFEAHPTAKKGDMAYVGAASPYDIYIWDEISGSWAFTGNTQELTEISVNDFYTKAEIDAKQTATDKSIKKAFEVCEFDEFSNTAYETNSALNGKPDKVVFDANGTFIAIKDNSAYSSWEGSYKYGKVWGTGLAPEPVAGKIYIMSDGQLYRYGGAENGVPSLEKIGGDLRAVVDSALANYNYLQNPDFDDYTIVGGNPVFSGWTADFNTAVYDDSLGKYVIGIEMGYYWRQSTLRSTPAQMLDGSDTLVGMCCTFWFKSTVGSFIKTNIGNIHVASTNGEWRQAKIYGKWDGSGFWITEEYGSDIQISHIYMTLDKLGDVEKAFDDRFTTLEREVTDLNEQVVSLIKPNITWITIDQNISDPATMISGDINGEQIQLIRNNSHRYLIGVRSSTGKEYRACQLSDSNSNMFNQMSDPSMDPSVDLAESGEVFVRIPDFYYKCYELRKDVWRIGFCYGSTVPEENAGWNFYKSKYIGAYKADMDEGGSTIYSRSAKTGRVIAAGYTRDEFIAMVKNRVSGATAFNILSWQDHCVIALLYFAQYGNADSYNTVGRGYGGTDPQVVNGETNSMGMTDSTYQVVNGKPVNLWGLENLWGANPEALSGISYVTNSSRTKFIIGTREVTIPTIVLGKGFLKLLFGEKGDLLPTAYGTTHNVGYTDVASGRYDNDTVSTAINMYYANPGVVALTIGNHSLPISTRITRNTASVTELANGDEYIAHINS